MRLREKIVRCFKPTVVPKIRQMIQHAESFGLPGRDVKNALEMLEANEWGLSFDIVIVQLYEYEIAVTEEFIRLAEEIMEEIAIDRDAYPFLYQLPKRLPIE